MPHHQPGLPCLQIPLALLIFITTQATKNLDMETMRVLLQHDADMSAADAPQGGRMPMHIAVSKTSQEAVELLLQHGADINCTWVGVLSLG